jgi:hypothetical protein
MCIERALPRTEYVASIAPKDLADTIANMAGFANDLLDFRTILGERQDGGNERPSTRADLRSRHAENRIIAYWQHQTLGEARCRPAAEGQSKMMDDAIQPAGPA